MTEPPSPARSEHGLLATVSGFARHSWPLSLRNRLVLLAIVCSLAAATLMTMVVRRERALAERTHTAYVAGLELGAELAPFIRSGAAQAAMAATRKTGLGFSVRLIRDTDEPLTGEYDPKLWRFIPLSLPRNRQPGITSPGNSTHLRILVHRAGFDISGLRLSSARGFPAAFASLSARLAASLNRVNIAIAFPGTGWLVISNTRFWNNDHRFFRYGWLFVLGLSVLLAGTPVLVRRCLHPLELLRKAIDEKNVIDGFRLPRPTGASETDRLAGRVNQLLDRIDRRLDDRTAFMAAISHDLGTPTTRIRLRAALIEDEDLRGKLIRDTDDMATMLRDLLAYLRNEVIEEPPRMVLFSTLVESLCHDYTDGGASVTFDKAPPLAFDTVPSMFSGKSHHLELNDERALAVLCRPNAMRRALQNLIDNALKYGGSACVRLDASASEISVLVLDRGPGLPESELEKVFQPFYRTSRTSGRLAIGSGLGLTIVRSIIEAHGGDITLINRNGGGLAAKCRIPRHVELD